MPWLAMEYREAAKRYFGIVLYEAIAELWQFLIKCVEEQSTWPTVNQKQVADLTEIFSVRTKP